MNADAGLIFQRRILNGLIAADDFLRGKIYFRNPLKDRDRQLNED